MPRTTLRLDDEALRIARGQAERHRIALGQAVSTLVKQGAKCPAGTVERNGFRVLQLGRRSPRVTAAQVDALLD